MANSRSAGTNVSLCNLNNNVVVWSVWRLCNASVLHARQFGCIHIIIASWHHPAHQRDERPPPTTDLCVWAGWPGTDLCVLADTAVRIAYILHREK